MGLEWVGNDSENHAREATMPGQKLEQSERVEQAKIRARVKRPQRNEGGHQPRDTLGSSICNGTPGPKTAPFNLREGAL
jgi:hypothetical protein